jgi:hydroxymethylpyrimidine kinase / phosphomethylpyrimidine kinase / thiamine-phosphate diphosphorylase
MKNVLSIAGHDPSNGAGITRDLEVFAAFGLHGLSVPTSLVIQGPDGVHDIYPIPVEPFMAMLDSLRGAAQLSGVKIGALADGVHVEQVAEFVEGLEDVPVVLDPIIAAKNSTRLITDDGLRRLVESLFPLVDLVTPNLDEAARILGAPVEDEEGMKQAATVIATMGPKRVLIKGGHLAGDPADLFFDGDEFLVLRKERVDREVHGTGCAFSSLILAFVVLGYPFKEAFCETETLMGRLLGESYRISETGYFYTSLARQRSLEAGRYEVLQSLKAAAARLEELNLVELIPEVQMNMGYGLREAKGTEDVAAFPGRIGNAGGKVCIKGQPEFGASLHVARLVVTYMKYYPHMRACVNLRFRERFVRTAKEKGMSVVFFDRQGKPDRLKFEEGRSLDYLPEEVLRAQKSPPDIIYDAGDVGKEPIIRLFARNPEELIDKMEMIRS